MERLIAYLLQSVLVSGMLTGYYWIALRNRRLHGFNRGYLLAALVLSLVLPLVRIGWSPWAARPVLGGAMERMENVSRAADGWFHWVTVGCWTCAVVSGVLLLVGFCRVAQVYRLKSRLSVYRMGGYDLIETDDPRAPFSFLRNLFWRRGADPDEPVNNKIFHHELAHIGGRHSWDGLFVQTLCCVCWMNPFFWIIRRELSVVHEFIADAATGMEGDAEGFALMLLQSMNEGRFLEPAQGFFQSPIKRRLVMLSNSRVSRFRVVRQTLVMPVVMLVTLLVSCSKDQPSAADPKTSPGKQIQIAKITLDNADLAKIKKDQLDKQTITIMYLDKDKQKREKPMTITFKPGQQPVIIEDKLQAEQALKNVESDH